MNTIYTIGGDLKWLLFNLSSNVIALSNLGLQSTTLAIASVSVSTITNLETVNEGHNIVYTIFSIRCDFILLPRVLCSTNL